MAELSVDSFARTVDLQDIAGVLVPTTQVCDDPRKLIGFHVCDTELCTLYQPICVAPKYSGTKSIGGVSTTVGWVRGDNVSSVGVWFMPYFQCGDASHIDLLAL